MQFTLITSCSLHCMTQIIPSVAATYVSMTSQLLLSLPSFWLIFLALWHLSPRLSLLFSRLFLGGSHLSWSPVYKAQLCLSEDRLEVYLNLCQMWFSTLSVPVKKLFFCTYSILQNDFCFRYAVYKVLPLAIDLFSLSLYLCRWFLSNTN